MKCPKCRFVAHHPEEYVYRPKKLLKSGKCNCVHCSNCGGTYCRPCRNPYNHMEAI